MGEREKILFMLELEKARFEWEDYEAKYDHYRKALYRGKRLVKNNPFNLTLILKVLSVQWEYRRLKLSQRKR